MAWQVSDVGKICCPDNVIEGCRREGGEGEEGDHDGDTSGNDVTQSERWLENEPSHKNNISHGRTLAGAE